MNLINQPSKDNIGSYIISNLNRNYNKFEFIVAYAKLSGVKYLINPINTFKSNGGQVIGIVGIDQYNTSLEAIQNLFDICDELYIYHSENLNQTFHPKVYYFESYNKIWISSGSSNMTSGGLFTNYECNIYNEIDSTDSSFSTLYYDINTLFKTYTNIENNCCLKITQEVINSLSENQYVYSEQQIALNRTTNNTHYRNYLFGTERFTVPHSLIQSTQNNDLLEENLNTINSSTTPKIHETNIIYSNTIATYASTYGSYYNFIQLIDGFSKNYYYIPQGVHLGHIFYIIKCIGDGHIDYRLTLFNSLTSGPDGNTARQTNYKVGACMELLLLTDYRLPDNITNDSFILQLSNNGHILYEILNNNVTDNDFYNFSTNSATTWRMVYNNPEFYINFIQNLSPQDKENLYLIFNNLTIFRLLVDYISNHQTNSIAISELYNEFWQYPPVVDYLNLIDISVPSSSSLKHRIPFLISLLRSFSIANYDSANPNFLIRI